MSLRIKKRIFGRAFCLARRSHDWISEHATGDDGRLFSLEHIKCRTCWETMIWLEMLEVIKKIPRQSWMDPECSLCDHTNVIQALAKNRNWRPSMTAEVLENSFCRRCRKYQARIQADEAVTTDEERPEPGVRQVRCPQCDRAFMAVGGTPGDEVPQDEVPLCRRCHQGLPSETCRVIRFRRRE